MMNPFMKVMVIGMYMYYTRYMCVALYMISYYDTFNPR
jgi:hypothetical protein